MIFNSSNSFTIYSSRDYGRSLNTRAAIFRQGTTEENDAQRSAECQLLETRKFQIKGVEYVGSLMSIGALIGILLLFQIETFDIGVVSKDLDSMKSWWTTDVLRTQLGYPEWHSDFAQERERVLQWMNASNYLGIRTQNGEEHGWEHGSVQSMKQYETLVLAYDNQAKYPATTWLYDIGSFRFDDEIMPITKGTPNEMTFAAYDTAYQTDLLKQCHSKYKPYEVMESWNEYSYRVNDRVINNYKVNLWGLLVSIYLISALFQGWRGYSYGINYRPLGPDVGRWVEYAITSPLMIMVIAISAGIREVSLIVCLLFMQLVLIFFGYVLEFFQEDFLTWKKYNLFSHLVGKHGTDLNKMNFGKRHHGSSLKINFAGGEPNHETKHLMEPEHEPHDEQSKDSQKQPAPATVDDFLEKMSEQKSCGNFSLFSNITEVVNSRRAAISLVYLLAFTLWGVMWTVIVVHLIRSDYILDDCSESPQKMPTIVYVIVFGQCAMFFLFGAISAYFWLVRLLPTSRKLDASAGDNVKGILQDVRKDTQQMWLDAAFYYGVMNVSSKLYLEITIFFFVAMYQSNINKHV